jgi:hypothetical protein
LKQTTDAHLLSIGWPIDQQNAGLVTSYFVRGQGIIESIPSGVDPGFAFNVGQSHLAGTAAALRDAIQVAASANVEQARMLLGDIMESTAFDAFLVNEQQSFPVMIFDQAQRELLRSQSSVAVLSSDTFAKQLIKHPELTIDDYRKLLFISEKPDLIFKQGDQRVILVKAESGKWLKATVKVKLDHSELFVVSYQWARDAEILRLVRNLELIFDARK